MFVGVVTDTQWKVFCEAFELGNLLADPSLKTNPQRLATRLDVPQVGSHTRELLAGAGYAEEAIERLIGDGVAHAARERVA
ncbi:MAG: hypothetical protein AAB325_03605 [Pseudomonadota bacterium]